MYCLINLVSIFYLLSLPLVLTVAGWLLVGLSCCIVFLCYHFCYRFYALSTRAQFGLAVLWTAGILTPFATRFDPHALGIVVLLGLFMSPKKTLSWFSELLILVSAWFFIDTVGWSDWRGFNLSTIFSVLNQKSGTIFPLYTNLLACVLFCRVAALFAAESLLKSAYFSGLIKGLWCAIVPVVLQLLDVPLPLVQEKSPFWEHLGRYSALFSDPNAFGVTVSLLLFLLTATSHYVLLVLWALLSLFSGSRLYMLALSLFAISVICRLFVGNEKKRNLVAALGIGGGVAVGAIVYCALFDYPQAVQRELAAFDISNLRQTFMTRTIFWSIGLQLWLDHMLVGIGFGNFPEIMTSYAARAGSDLNLWIDNPNSFYLGLLSELGLCGLFCFGVGCFRLTLKKTTKQNKKTLGIFQSGVLVFLLLLMFGPHFYFIECSLVAAVLLSGVLQQKTVERSNLLVASSCAVGVLGLLLFSQSSNEYGWYPWEREIWKEGPRSIRWSRPQAQMNHVCIENEVKFDLLNPAPTKVIIATNFESLQVNPSVAEWRTIILDCKHLKSLRVSFNTEQGWIPSLNNSQVVDWRILGVRVSTDPRSVAARAPY
jgi:hypothetical protein